MAIVGPMNGNPLPTTPLDIIKLALKMANVLGVGQDPSPEDTNDAFQIMNMMMKQWQRRRYMVYQLVEASKVATGAQSYTVGTGGDFNIARPSKLEFAYFRQFPNAGGFPVDYPLKIIRAREDYDRIQIKTLNAFPQFAFYDAGYPLGNLFVWPIPSNLYEIHITVMTQLQAFQNVSDQIVLPDEYKAALMYNLALELYPMYGLPVNPVVQGKAKATMDAIEEANAQIPRLIMPDIFQARRGTFNVYGDVPVSGGF